MMLIRSTLLTLSLTAGSLAAIAETPTPPPIAGTAYILIDAETGQTLAELNSEKQLAPASLTKMMTDYVVAAELKRGAIHNEDMVHISQNAWWMKRGRGGSEMFVSVNSDVPLQDLLRGMIIQSGNDASIALAEHVAGSEDAFADMMNKKAAELGMKHSSFRNPTGLPNPQHFTTAHDLAILGAAMIRDFPEQYKIYSEKEFRWNGIKQPNRNLLLWRDPSVDGIKTGHTDEAGYCLVASAKRGDTRLVSVVLGTASEEIRAQESEKLLNYGFHNFQTVKLYEAGKVLQTARVWDGVFNEVNAGIQDAVALSLPRGEQDKLKAQISLDKIIRAPVKEGQVIGSLSLLMDGKEIINRPVVALSPVAQANIIMRWWDELKIAILHLFGKI